MKEKQCKNCMKEVNLVELEHPKTGENDEKALWIMCDCKGYRLGDPEKINYPKTWKNVNKH